MATTSIQVAETPAVTTFLWFADDALVHGHRLSEWTGHAPTLEEDLALANVALDLIGQARALYQVAERLTGHTEDALAYLREQHQFRNALIMELPRGDFAFTILRLFLTAAAAQLSWQAATRSPDPDLAAIAGRSVKETGYHLRHAGDWVVRLGDGTAESHRRAQAALDALWPYTGELFEPAPAAFAPVVPREVWLDRIDPVLHRATLARPADGWMQRGGRFGRHTEHLGHMLAEMQVLPRTYPGAVW